MDNHNKRIDYSVDDFVVKTKDLDHDVNYRG